MAMRKVLNPGTRAALVAVAALAWAHSAAAAGSQAALSVRVVVLPAARVQAHSAVKTVLLSAGHVDTRRLEVPGALSALAKAGAWVMEKLPGADPFIKPWMIDRANDHYEIDITRARALLGWEPKRSLRETIPKMVAALKADPLNFYQKNGLELTSELEEQAETKAKKKGKSSGA